MMTIAAVAAAGVVLLVASPAAAQYCLIGPQWEKHPPAGVAQSGYDPFVIDHQTGRFRYVPIPYAAEPPGGGYNPYRINWHSGQWDYVPIPTEQDYRRWDAAAAARADALMRGGGNASNFIDGRIAPVSVPAIAVPAVELTQSRGDEDVSAVSRRIPAPPEPTPPPRWKPQARQATTRPSDEQRQPPPTTAPTLARKTPAPTVAPKPAATPSASASSASSATPGGDGRWVRLRGVTGRWEYDFAHARWIFVLPSD